LPPKAAPQSYSSSKQLIGKVVPESWPKLCSPKVRPKAVPRSCFPKLYFKVSLQCDCPKAAIFQIAMVQIYSLKWFLKIILQSGFRKLLPKIAAESCSPKFYFKINSRNYFPKLRFFKIVIQNCLAKLLLTYSWSNTILQTYSTKLFPKMVPPFPNLLPKISPQNDYPKNYYISNLKFNLYSHTLKISSQKSQI
jgi:hypothetical protein